jgi:hypothetical protein
VEVYHAYHYRGPAPALYPATTRVTTTPFRQSPPPYLVHQVEVYEYRVLLPETGDTVPTNLTSRFTSHSGLSFPLWWNLFLFCKTAIFYCGSKISTIDHTSQRPYHVEYTSFRQIIEIQPRQSSANTY